MTAVAQNLVYKHLELGEKDYIDESTAILAEKRRILAEEEVNARCVFRGLLRFSIVFILLLFGSHLLFQSSRNHHDIRQGDTASSTTVTCNGVIIQHPQKFDCVVVNGKFEIVNKITGVVSENGNDDKDDDDYNDNTNAI